MNEPVRACFALGLTLVLASGCASSTGGGAEEPIAAPSQSAQIDVPDGVDLTGAGARLAIGERASAIYTVDDQRTSVISVTVDKIVSGSTKRDFKDFSLTAKSRASTPYYVDAVVRNDGPGALDKARVPVFGYDSSKAYFPPSDLIGRFDRCVGGPLPVTFEAGDTVKRCLVFLVPAGETLSAVQLRTEDVNAPISWPAPD